MGIALAVLLLVVAGNAVVRALLHDDRVPADAVLGAGAAQATPDDVVALASDDATIEVDDMVYSLVASDEGYVLARQYAGSGDEPSALFEITGEPVGFTIHRGTFYVVSQAGGSFYIQAYVPADGSVPTDYREGEGTIVGMEISNGALVLVDDAGEEQSFDLPQA